MTACSVIRATQDHVAILSELGKLTFAETFTGMQYYTEAIVSGYTAKAFAPEVIARELASPKVQYFLCQEQGNDVGYAKLVEKEPAACMHDLKAIYLERIYFTKAAQGKGFGKRLMAEVFREARARRYAHLWLSVWEYNTTAVAFYRRLGFRHAGEWDWTFELEGVSYVDRDWVFAIDVPEAEPA